MDIASVISDAFSVFHLLTPYRRFFQLSRAYRTQFGVQVVCRYLSLIRMVVSFRKKILDDHMNFFFLFCQINLRHLLPIVFKTNN